MADAIKIDGLDLASGGAAVGQACCAVYLSGAQTIAHATDTVVQLDTELFDVRDEWDVANYRFTAKDAGYYLINAQITYIDPVANNILYCFVRSAVAGTGYIESALTPAAAYNNTVRATGVVYLSAGDTIQLITRQTCGGNEDIRSGRSHTRMDISKIASIGMTGSPRVSVYPSAAATSIATATPTIVPLDTEVFDLYGEWDTANYRFTAKEAGYYLIEGKVQWTATVDQSRYEAMIYDGASDIEFVSLHSSLAGSVPITPSVHKVVYLNAGDTIFLRCNQTSGVNQNVVGNAVYNTYLTISRLDCSGGGGFNSVVKLWNNANQSIADSSDVALTFNTEVIDTKGLHSTAVNTSRITFTEAGVYSVGAAVRWDNNGNGYRWLHLRINGAAWVASALEMNPDAGAPDNPVQEVNVIYEFSPGDYIEAVVNQTSGGNLNSISVGTNRFPQFWAYRIN